MSEPLRILHVLGGPLVRGGTETWLINVLRRIERERFKIDFMFHTAEEGTYDDEARRLGARIFVATNWRNLITFLPACKKIIRDNGPYDILHSHAHNFSGVMLMVAKHCGVPVRVAHSHTDLSRLEQSVGPARKLYLTLTRRMIRRYASAGLAVSADAAADLFGADWRADPRWRVYFCALDFQRFGRPAPDRPALRAALGIPPRAFVIGHVGRLVELKNHRFLLEVMREVSARKPECRLLLVGKGPLEPELRQRAAELNLTQRVVFAGGRDDVPELLRGAIDCFIFPSLHEGLGLAMLEAQAAGLPVFCSDVIPPEADVVGENVRRLPLAASPADWAAAVLEQSQPAIPAAAALQRVLDSTFNIDTAIIELQMFYTNLIRNLNGKA